MTGQTIAHYKILEKLGAGGMGVVYKAQDLQLERLVALKFIPHEAGLSESDRERILREARAASALDHPNIGVIHGVDRTEDGQFFLVMAYYEGQTLAQMTKIAPPPLPEALNLVLQTAAGLAAAHARNIVHRDIKPANIIVTKQGVAKIVDFGLAKIVASASATLTGGTTGTLPYMAPEQILGEAVDQRSDVWALGVLLVGVVTGLHPFAGENNAAMTFAILNQAPKGIESLPGPLQPIVLCALSKQPEFRYPSAKEMLQDLEEAKSRLEGAPEQVTADAATMPAGVSAKHLKETREHASAPRWKTAASIKKPRGAFHAAAGLLGAVVLLGALLAVPAVRERALALLRGGAESHIAVLPFDNIGNDPANEAVAEGLMDSLTSKLSNLDAAQKSLWVVPASVVRGQKISDPSAAGKELGANFVVKGSIRRDGRNVQLTVNLIDAKDLRQIGSAALEDRTGDLAGLQDEAVARLARLMNINVTAEMLRATGGRASPAAYELYLKALGLMQRYDKPENLEQAIGALNEAVKTDPKFALGYASLGQAYQLKYLVDQNPKWVEEASSYCKQAIALDDHLPSTYVTLGRIHDASGKYDLAVQEFQHALRLDSRNADAINGLALAHEKAGRIEEAEKALQRAVALKPDYWEGYNDLGLFYDRLGKYDLAIAQLQRAVQLTPDNAQAYLNLGAVYIDTGDAKRFPEAEAALKKSIELNPRYETYANLGQLLFLQGRYAEAASATEKALQLNDRNYLVWRNLAEFYLWMKQTEKAAAAHDRELRILEETSKMQTQNAELLSELATIYAHKHLAEKAQTFLQRALALAPNDSSVLMDAAGVYETLGDRAQAIRYAQEGVSKGFSMDDLKRRYTLQAILNDPHFRAQVKK